MAKHVIHVCQDQLIPVDNLALQQILFDIQQSFPDKSSTPHFETKPLELGFGPLYPEVYQQYCGFSNRPIMDYDEDTLVAKIKPDEESRILQAIRKWISTAPDDDAALVLAL